MTCSGVHHAQWWCYICPHCKTTHHTVSDLAYTPAEPGIFNSTESKDTPAKKKKKVQYNYMGGFNKKPSPSRLKCYSKNGKNICTLYEECDRKPDILRDVRSSCHFIGIDAPIRCTTSQSHVPLRPIQMIAQLSHIDLMTLNAHQLLALLMTSQNAEERSNIVTCIWETSVPEPPLWNATALSPSMQIPRKYPNRQLYQGKR